MTLHTFIRRNRATIDATIRSLCPNIGSLNDDIREDWIANDEGLYTWAQRAGVAL